MGRLMLLAGLWGYASAALCASSDFVELGILQDFSFAMWASGDGDQSAAQVTCAASADTNKTNPRPRDQASRFPYDHRVSDLAPSPGYYVYLNNDTTNTGNARIAAVIRHRDVIEGTGYESLNDDIYDSHAHDGQFRNCLNGDNSELSLTINAAELEKARAGSYTGNFRAEIRGGLSGTTTDAKDFRVTIDVANLVKISSLQNIDLGSWSGTGAVDVTAPFCVYSNNASAAYNITITSPNQDASANFFLVDAGATAQIPYTLWFKDDTTPGMGVTVSDLPISGTGNNSATNCAGLDNAKLSLTISQPDLEVVPPDVYGDTLTLLVAPE